MKTDKASSMNFSNPAIIMPVIILGAVLVYFLYYAIDKVGLETRTVDAVVTAKTHTPGSTTYVNRIAGKRSWTQAQEQPDFYAVSISVENQPTVALVTRERFDRLRVNDRVRATIRRTRISGRIEVTRLE